MVLLNLLYFLVVTWHFQRQLAKDFEEEMDRQIKAEHFIYSSLAHDLKTPLTTIKGYAQALKDGKICDPDQESSYQLINRKADEMVKMVEDLMVYSSLVIQDEDPQIQRVNLSQALTALIADHYQSLEDHGVELDLEIQPEVFGQVNPSDFNRIVDNLLSNAVKHNPPGIRLKVALKQAGPKIIPKVLDNGHELDSDQVFDPFYKGDSTRPSGQGQGLGLAIVAHLSAKYQGRAYLEPAGPAYTKAFVVEFSKSFSM